MSERHPNHFLVSRLCRRPVAIHVSQSHSAHMRITFRDTQFLQQLLALFRFENELRRVSRFNSRLSVDMYEQRTFYLNNRLLHRWQRSLEIGFIMEQTLQ
jgi:hypothetical protein